MDCLKKFSKNDIVELEITAVSSDGNGIGKTGGIVVFVPNVAKGDNLQVKILKVKKNYAFAKIEKILTPSDDRIISDCANATQCGGCVFRHITYNAETELKETRVRDALERIGAIKDLKTENIVASQRTEKYRNKAQFPIGKNKNGGYELGFFAKHSHRIVPCDSCLLQPDVFNEIMQAFKKWATETQASVYDEMTGKGTLRHLYIRRAEATGEIMVCVVANANKLRGEDLLAEYLKDCSNDVKSIIINSNLENTNVILGENSRTIYGSDYIRDEMCGLTFYISANSFYQVNTPQAEVLYSLAKKYANLSKDETLLDLYCGTGTIGLTMASDCKKLIGVEIVEQAVNDAKKNALANKISNAEFICADAMKATEILAAEKEMPDVVVVDPPRKGCSEGLIQIITEKMRPKRVIYVSCDPATLARDIKIFTQNGYKAQAVTPVDMFPRTAHVESVALLEKTTKQTKTLNLQKNNITNDVFSKQ